MRVLQYISAMSMLVFAQLAQSTPLMWTLQGATLQDSTPVTGSFTYDANTNFYSNFDILGNGFHFTSIDTQYPFDDHSFLAVTSEFGEAAGAPVIFMSFAVPLSDAGGTTALLDGGIFQCGEYPAQELTCLFGTGVGQFIVGGSVTALGNGSPPPVPAPEPGTATLILAGLGIAWLRFARRSAAR